MFKYLSYNLNAEQRKVVLLSSMGGLLEFYDFTIYGLFAGYFAHQFFPAHDEFISIIASYSVFVVGYVVRPIGGIIFSHIGDAIGRKTVLILTMVLMGIASIGIALLPTYEQIGIYAPALMLLFRLIQGLAIGGELPSMIVYVSESMPENRAQGMGGIFSGTVAGLIPSMLINLAIVKFLTPEQITAYGWRIPFLVGGLLCFIAYRVRRELHESALFKNINKHENLPFIELLQHHLGKVLIGVGLVSIMATPIILVIVFMPTYLTKIVKVDAKVVSHAILVATFASVASTYIMGKLINVTNLLKVTYSCLVGIFISAIVCYSMIALHQSLVIALVVFAIFQGFLVTIPPIFLSYLFPIEVRLTGVALSYNLSFVLFGGLTPIVVTTIIEKSGMIYVSPILVLLVTIVFATWAVFKFRKTVR